MKRPLTIAFLSGFVVMLYELLVIRLASPWIGSSFTVWSGTMSLILFGLFLGNLVGGVRGDKNRDPRELAMILATIGIAMLITQTTSNTLLSVGSAPLLAMSTHQSLSVPSSFAIFALFGFYGLALIPALLMGMICPYLVSLFGDRTTPGQSSAHIFGCSSVGGIFGTLIGGAILIPFAGIQISFIVAIGIIASLAALLHRTPATMLSLVLMCGSSYLYQPKSAEGVIETRESVYGHLEVRQRGTVKQLILGSPYSTQSIDTGSAADSKRHIWYQLPKLSLLKSWSRTPRRAVILGLGAGTMVEPLRSMFPGIEVHGVELDPEIVSLGRSHFSLNVPAEQVHIMDARAFVQSTELDFDIVIADAYRPPTIPQQLASIEFFEALQNMMSEESILLLNYSGVYHQQTVSTMLQNTIEAVFGQTTPLKLLGSVNSALVAFKGQGFDQPPTLPWTTLSQHDRTSSEVFRDDRNGIEILQELEMLRYAWSKL